MNWEFRLPGRVMNAGTRNEISTMFAAGLEKLQFRGQGHRDGHVCDSYGIVYVRVPYEARAAK